LAPDSRLAREAIVLADPVDGVLTDSYLDQLADVQFWVPGFLATDIEQSRRFVAAMPRLQVIQTQSAGVDRILPVVPAGAVLCDARGVHGSSTSEWALTAMLSVLREFPRFERARQERHWQWTVTEELAGKKVLIIGAGDVGDALARRVAACDAEPIMVARTARPGVHGTAELPGLAGTADIVVLIVPLTSQTRGLVDARFLATMGDGALLVNAARGPVVDTEALLAELSTGRLRAALDVTDPEPLPADHPLWQAPNLLLTPHIGGAVAGLRQRMETLLAEQVRRFEAGEQLLNVVSGEY
jgi:phosphoglycerate dehydrogenase-like enzyme